MSVCIAFVVAASFASSNGSLSDGGAFYSDVTSQRPSSLLKTIPIIKTEKVSNLRRCYLTLNC